MIDTCKLDINHFKEFYKTLKSYFSKLFEYITNLESIDIDVKEFIHRKISYMSFFEGNLSIEYYTYISFYKSSKILIELGKCGSNIKVSINGKKYFIPKNNIPTSILQFKKIKTINLRIKFNIRNRTLKYYADNDISIKYKNVDYNIFEYSNEEILLFNNLLNVTF